jgi:hypothetical protein
MAERKDRMALLSRYSKLHNSKYGERPSLNLNVEQWAADALITSYGIEECYDLLEYYFSVSQTPSWKYFANYAETIVSSQKQIKQDLKEREERRKMARAWLDE